MTTGIKKMRLTIRHHNGSVATNIYTMIPIMTVNRIKLEPQR